MEKNVSLKSRCSEKILKNIDLKRIYELDILPTLKEEIFNAFDWFAFSTKNLTDVLIEKYADYVNWSVISCDKKLSEEFIEKNQDKVHWSDIAVFQDLSEEL